MRLALVMLILVGCSDEPPPRSVPAVHSAVQPVAHPAASSQPTLADPLPPPDRSRVFQERLVLRADPKLEDCGPFLMDMSVTPSGDAWVVGDCNVRLRIGHDGAVDDHAVGWLKAEASQMGHAYTCPARMFFEEILAVSETEIYARGSRTCGTDPNSVWPQRVERFDGARWKPVPWPESPGRLELSADGTLSGFSCCAHRMVSGRDVALPANAFRWQGARWVKSELPAPNGLEDATAVGFAPDGTVWLIGNTHQVPNRPVVASGRDGAWTDHAIAGSWANDVSVAPDGSVWVGTDRGLFRRHDDRWTTVMTGVAVSSVRARSASEAWFIATVFGKTPRWAVVHRRGDHAVSIAVKGEEAPQDDAMGLALSAEQVWLLGRHTVAQLMNADAATGAAHVRTLTPPPAKLDRWRPR